MMKIYDVAEAPIKVWGIPMLYETGEYRRLPDSVMERVQTLTPFGKRTVGGRIGFRTNASEFTLRCHVKLVAFNHTCSLLSTSGFNVYIGEKSSSTYAGFLCLPELTWEWTTIEKTFQKSSNMEEITIFMPGVVLVKYCEIIVDEKAIVMEPTPYKYEKPIVYYGSSITAGGAASRVGTTYVSLLSRWLDADYMNFGFPGNARGEDEVAYFIKQYDMSAFVYDYDHNAESVVELKKTHQRFFQIIRDAKPDLPIIMISRPNYDLDPLDAEKRKEVILETYNSAKNAGDKNVYFIDGKELFGDFNRHACTTDEIHPTDFGFMNMARYILPTLEKALGKTDACESSHW